MVTFNVEEKTYKVRFGYGVLSETDILDKVSEMGNIDTSKPGAMKKLISVLPELLLAGLQKYHKETFGYETEEEKKEAFEKVCDLLDKYEEEGTEDVPKNGFEMLNKLSKELMDNGFLSGIQNSAEKESTVVPMDHQKKAK